MRYVLLAAAVFVGCLMAGSATAPIRGDDCPRYLILEPLPNGQANGVQAPLYAYGWFGAGRYSSSTWHRNYSGTGLRWTYTPGY